MRNIGATVIALALGTLSLPTLAVSPAEGEWVTEGDKARVAVAPCAADTATFCGTITCVGFRKKVVR